MGRLRSDIHCLYFQFILYYVINNLNIFLGLDEQTLVIFRSDWWQEDA